MPGDYDQKFAGARAFLGYMMSAPGKKLNFMGTEFAQFIEWNFQQQLDWMLLGYDNHRQLHDYVRELNRFYKENPALWQIEDSWEGYQWIDANDSSRNMISYVRTDEAGKQVVVIVNFAPVAWEGCVIGVPDASSYTVALSSDEARFGGSGKDPGRLKVDKKTPCHDFQQSITLDVPPMSALYLVGRPRPKRAPKAAAEKAPKTTAKAGKAAKAEKAPKAAEKAPKTTAKAEKPKKAPRAPKQKP